MTIPSEMNLDRQPVQKKKRDGGVLVGVAILVVFAFIIGRGLMNSESDTQAPVVTEAPVVDVGTGTGDWASAEAYALDIAETLDAIAVIQQIVGDSAVDTGNGLMSFASFATIADEAITTLDTHIDYFAYTVAPAVFTDMHHLVLRGMDQLREALVLARDGAVVVDADMFYQATEKLMEASDTFDRAYAAMPEGLG